MKISHIFAKKSFRIGFILFISLNVFLYYFIQNFHTEVIFDSNNYQYNSWHYLQDPRIEGKSFNFLRAIGTWDAQWYLFIAEKEYPVQHLYYATYAFFPFYPFVLHLANYIFSNIELTAFILANVLMVANFISMYYIFTKLYSSQIALRSIFLLFIFPFSIFYRSYYTEGLFLFLLLWFSYFVIKRKLFKATCFFAFLCVTRPTGMFLAPVFLYAFYDAIRKRAISVPRILFFLFLSSVPFLLWMAYCYLQTGNMFIWKDIQEIWYKPEYPFWTPLRTHILNVFNFWNLSLHSAHFSQIDTLMVIFVLTLIIISKKSLHRYLWWISFFLFVPILLIKDTMSFSRFQSIIFPLYIYLGMKLQGVLFIVVSIILLISLLIMSLFFVNWHWIG